MPAIISSRGIIIGPVGSDAGYWVLGPNGFHHVGGWGREAMAEVTAAVTVLGAASQVANRGVQSRMLDMAHATLKPHMEYLDKAFDEAGASARVPAE